MHQPQSSCLIVVPAGGRRGSMQFQRSDSIVGSPAKPYLHGCSRLEAEFEEMESLGSGGFGDVVKVYPYTVYMKANFLNF